MAPAAPGLPSLKRFSSVGQAGALAALVALVVLLVGASQLTRSGYSPDEELTVFAVRGLQATGLPLLPSNLLYDRGLAYSYASWAAGSVVGGGLALYRAVALLSAVAALVFIYWMVSRFGSTIAAAIAILLVSTSVPFWAAATVGRFYAPFLALYLATLFRLSTLSTNRFGTLGTFGTLTTLGTLALLAFVSRLTHELAFTMAALPLFCLAVSGRGNRAQWLWPTVAVMAGLAAAQAGIFALHYLAPSSGDTMIQRFFVWQVVNLFETPPDRQFGIVLVVLVIAWLIAPLRARRNLVIALCGVAFIVGLSIARALTIAPFSWALVQSVLSEGSRYPLDMFWHIGRTTPVTIALALGLLVARLSGAGGEWRPIERAAHLLWIGWVLWFGVMESGITTNYLLLPVSLMLVAIAVDLSAILTHTIDPRRRAGQMVSWAVCALTIAAVIGDQWRAEGSFEARLEAVRPTINVAGIDEIRESLQPGDRIACTDELGCLMLVGRIDAWLALDDFVRERFVVKKSDGQLVGVYTGKPAVFRPADLFETAATAERTLVVDVFKEFSIGNSRDWLPRALERDGLDVKLLLQTPQARVVQISLPTQHAGTATRN